MQKRISITGTDAPGTDAPGTDVAGTDDAASFWHLLSLFASANSSRPTATSRSCALPGTAPVVL
jgi:hypothetical protein